MTSVRMQGPADEVVSASFCVLGLGDEVHWTSLALMHGLRSQGFRVAGLLPQADDVQWHRGRWRSERVLQLQEAGSFAFPVSALCPTVQGGSPGVPPPLLDIEAVVDAGSVLGTWADLVVVDALGTPDTGLAKHRAGRPVRPEAADMADVALAMDWPVVVACDDSGQGLHDACQLVTRLRDRGLRVVAWIQAGLTPMACAAGLVCVGAIPRTELREPVQAARHVDLVRLLDVLGVRRSGAGPHAHGVSANAHKTGGRAG